MAGRRYKHPDTLKDRRASRLSAPPLDIVPATPRSAVPPAPAGLRDKSREIWRTIWELSAVRAEDEGMARRYILDLDEWTRAHADLAALRAAFVPAGAPPELLADYYRAAKPIHARLRNLDATCHAYEQALGLNPLARMRLNIQAVTAAASLEEFRRTFAEEGAALGAADETPPGGGAAGYLIDPDD